MTTLLINAARSSFPFSAHHMVRRVEMYQSALNHQRRFKEMKGLQPVSPDTFGRVIAVMAMESPVSLPRSPHSLRVHEPIEEMNRYELRRLTYQFEDIDIHTTSNLIRIHEQALKLRDHNLVVELMHNSQNDDYKNDFCRRVDYAKANLQSSYVQPFKIRDLLERLSQKSSEKAIQAEEAPLRNAEELLDQLSRENREREISSLKDITLKLISELEEEKNAALLRIESHADQFVGHSMDPQWLKDHSVVSFFDRYCTK